jgi:hypothetical protein
MVGWANLLRFIPYVQVADTQRDAWDTPKILQQGIAYPHSSPVQISTCTHVIDRVIWSKDVVSIQNVFLKVMDDVHNCVVLGC